MFIGAFFIVSNGNLHLRDSGQREQFVNLYYDWLAKIFGNTKTVTGYVVNMNWLP